MDKAQIVEVIWWVLVLYCSVIRIKYFWAGMKVIRTKSCASQTTKGMTHTFIEYIIMFSYNFNISDARNMFFWFFGIFTVGFVNVVLYLYREDKSDNVFQWIWKGLLGKLKNEGGILL